MIIRRLAAISLVGVLPLALGAGNEECSHSKAVRVPGSSTVTGTTSCTVTVAASLNLLIENLAGLRLQKTIQCQSLDVTEDSAYCTPTANMDCVPKPPALHYLLDRSCAGIYVPLVQSPCRSKKIILGFLENYSSRYCSVPPPVLKHV